MLRVSRGCLVVALLVFVNVQLLILVLRSHNLLLTQADIAATPHFSLATIARGDNRQLRGDSAASSANGAAPAKKPKSDQSSLFAAPDNLAALLGHSVMPAGWNNPFASSSLAPLAALTSPSIQPLPSSAAPMSADAVERETSGGAALPPALRPVRPLGKWARQMAPLRGAANGGAFELVDGERARLAEALGSHGANFSSQVSPRFAVVPAWVWAGGASRLLHFRPRQRRKAPSLPAAEVTAAGADDDDGARSAELLIAGLGGGVPCLFSQSTGRNVFLVAAATAEWTALQRGTVSGPLLAELLSGQRRCPKPAAGQLGPSALADADASAARSGWGSGLGVGLGAPQLSGGGGPEVSFIIPMHDHVSVTLECLLSLLRFADEVPSVEYVLVDDGSLEDVDEIRVFLRHMKESFGVRVKFHRQHLGVGYASIMTQASRLAEGRYLMLLNNDVMMTRGAIRALYSLLEDVPGAGVAVPQFVQADGKILDAGGIIFTDASAWQYGRGVPAASREAHPYNYVRDVDYGTAACLLIRRALFLDLGMYDARYAEDKGAYYEDTDMSFHVRASGFRVLYTPFATVLHHESLSYGDQTKKKEGATDASSGCGNNGNGCTQPQDQQAAVEVSAATGGVSAGPIDAATGAKKALMTRGKAKFSSEWGAALTCTFLHKSVGSQLDAFVPATRLSTLRLLVAVDAALAEALLCGDYAYHLRRDSGGDSQAGVDAPSRGVVPQADHDQGSLWGLAAGVGHRGEVVRLRAMLETFIAAKVHVTLVLTGHDAVQDAQPSRNSAGAHGEPSGTPSVFEVPALGALPGCSCAGALRYLGVHVVPSLDLLVFPRKPTKKDCRYDAVLVAGVAPYKRILLDLRDKCPNAPIVFDTPDLAFMREVRTQRVATTLPPQRPPGSQQGQQQQWSDGDGGGGGGGGSRDLLFNQSASRKLLFNQVAHDKAMTQRQTQGGGATSSGKGGAGKGSGKGGADAGRSKVRVFESPLVAGEVQFMSNSAVTIASSAFELGALRDQLPRAQVVLVPRPVALRPTLAPFAERSGLVFAGNLYDQSDVESLLWLVDLVMPRLRASLDSRLDALVAQAVAAEKAAAPPAGQGSSVHHLVDPMAAAAAEAATAETAETATDAPPRPGGLSPLDSAQMWALRDLVIHVVQVDGRPLPPRHALPARLVAFNGSTTSGGWRAPPTNANTSTASSSDGSRDQGVTTGGRMLVLHDLWSHGQPCRLPEPTAMHRQVEAAAAKVRESINGGGGAAASFFGGRRLLAGPQQAAAGGVSANEVLAKSAPVEEVIARGLWRAGAELLRFSGAFLVSLGKLAWEGGRSVVFGEPMDFAWACRDAVRWGKRAKRGVQRWWGGGAVGGGARDNDQDDDNDNGASQDGRSLGDRLADSVGFGATGREADNVVFRGFGVDVMPSSSDRFQCDDPLAPMDALYRMSRVAVVPLRRVGGGGAFAHATAAMSRGVPVVATSAAAATAPGWSQLFPDPRDRAPAEGEEDGRGFAPVPNGSPLQQAEVMAELAAMDGSAATTSTNGAPRPVTAAPLPPLLVADDAGAFADAVAAAYLSPSLWRGVAAGGFKAMRQDASLPALVTQTAALLELLMKSPPTTMAAAHKMQTLQARSTTRAPASGGGFSAFSRQVDFGRKALAMGHCSDDHTADLLTFLPVN